MRRVASRLGGVHRMAEQKWRSIAFRAEFVERLQAAKAADKEAGKSSFSAWVAAKLEEVV